VAARDAGIALVGSGAVGGRLILLHFNEVARLVFDLVEREEGGGGHDGVAVAQMRLVAQFVRQLPAGRAAGVRHERRGRAQLVAAAAAAAAAAAVAAAAGRRAQIKVSGH